jgi:hypothetical protein
VKGRKEIGKQFGNEEENERVVRQGNKVAKYCVGMRRSGGARGSVVG